jgi:hypothetical protein
MKIRIGDQSLRVRISAAEAEALHQGKEITTTLHFNAIDVFEVVLRTWNLSIAEVHYQANQLTASIPLEASQHLVTTRGYTFRSEQQGADGKPLSFEVEIDLEKAKHA